MDQVSISVSMGHGIADSGKQFDSAAYVGEELRAMVVKMESLWHHFRHDVRQWPDGCFEPPARVDLGDSRVPDVFQNVRLGFEPSVCAGLANLEGDRFVDQALVGLEDPTHAPFAKQANDPIACDFLADEDGGIDRGVLPQPEGWKTIGK